MEFKFSVFYLTKAQKQGWYREVDLLLHRQFFNHRHLCTLVANVPDVPFRIGEPETSATGVNLSERLEFSYNNGPISLKGLGLFCHILKKDKEINKRFSLPCTKTSRGQ